MAEEPSNKRRRVKTTEDYTQRKRVPLACQFCRLRKAKCDNVRPSCGFCRRHKATCIYGADDKAGDTSPQNQVVDQPPDQKILQRLDEIKDMLEKFHHATPPNGDDTMPESPPKRLVVRTDGHILSSPLNSYKTANPDHSQSQNHKPSPYISFRCESIIKWPVFKTTVPGLENMLDSLTPVPNAGFESTRLRTQTQQSSIIPNSISDPNSFSFYAREFLVHFHPRNPILDEHELLTYARAADEEGLGWDSASCLILLVCALTTTNDRWSKPTGIYHSADEIPSPGPPPKRRALAEFYFLEAKKRIGMLGNTLLDIQCLFLAFIFEKAYLRPLQAWFYLHQAASWLKIRLLHSGSLQNDQKEISNITEVHLEQRLFWSCFRGERELHLQIDLPPSGLEALYYPHPLPEPPLPYGCRTSEGGTEEWSLTSQEQRIVEGGWYYYLAEISLRRTIDETLALLYEKGEEYWLQDPAKLISQYHDLNKQRCTWQKYLPEIVQFDEDTIPDNQFAHGLRARFMQWHELILRPILYCAIHLPSNQLETLPIVPLAEKAVTICSKMITQTRLTSRHGGSWFIARGIFSDACLILAVVLHPGKQVRPPPKWKLDVQLVIRTLEIWGKEAESLERMATTLKKLYLRACEC